MPLTAPAKLMAAVVAPLHISWFITGVTFGVGFTVMLLVLAVPVQPLADGVTSITAVTGVLLKLLTVKAAILPVPLAARPTEVVLLVQL